MKKVLDIFTWGIRLYVEEVNGKKSWVFEYADPCAPVDYTVRYETKDEALGDIVNYILNPDNVYALDELPDNFQRAFTIAGTPMGVNPTNPDANYAVGTFLYYMLEGIVEGNLYELGM